MQFDIIENYDIEKLFNSIINFLEKVVVNNYFSVMYLKNKFVSLSYFGHERFCIELCNSKPNILVHDFANCTINCFLTIYDISTFLTDTIGCNSGKKFLIYLKSGFNIIWKILLHVNYLIIYIYLKKNLFPGYRIIVPAMKHGRRYDILWYNHLIISFCFRNNNLYYSIDSNESDEIKTIKDVDCALNKCNFYFCDKNFSLFFKCNLI